MMRLRISKICVPTDFSGPADHAVRYAAGLAQHFNAQLHLLHVLEHAGQLAQHPEFMKSGEATHDFLATLESIASDAAKKESELAAGPGDPTVRIGHVGQYADLLRAAQQGAAAKFDALREHWWDGLEVSRDLRYGHPVKEINHYVESKAIDLVVIGSQGHSKLASLLLGSVTERVVQTCGCPVIVVRHPEHDFQLVDE
jgi:nucleotide-binding universal stress UspA family protein